VRLSSGGLPDLQQVGDRGEVLQEPAGRTVQAGPGGRVEPVHRVPGAAVVSRVEELLQAGDVRVDGRQQARGAAGEQGPEDGEQFAGAGEVGVGGGEVGATALVGVAGQLELQGVLEDFVGAQWQVGGGEVLAREGLAQPGGVGGQLLGRSGERCRRQMRQVSRNRPPKAFSRMENYIAKI